MIGGFSSELLKGELLFPQVAAWLLVTQDIDRQFTPTIKISKKQLTSTFAH